MSIYNIVPQNQLGNRYKSISVSVPNNVTDWSLCENNPVTFPDWNLDWNERDYWTICIIKQLTNVIYLKFHGEQYDSIRLLAGDSPIIFEHFVYRDIYITNNNNKNAEFDIILINNRTIFPPPFKPENLNVSAISQTSIELIFEDNTIKNENEKIYFKIERSDISETTGFSQIATKQDNIEYENTITYIDSSCSPNTQYWYRIRTYSDKGGNSGYCDVGTDTTPI